MKVTIVIRTKNEGEKLNRLLKSIYAQVVSFSFEVVIVDTNSTDNTKDIAKKFKTRIITISQDNFSYPISLNIGVDNASGEIIVFISGHAFPVNNSWLQTLINCFDETDIVAATGTLLVCPEHCNNPYLMFYQNSVPQDSFYYSKEKQYLTNTNSAIRREILIEIPFDENVLDTEEIYWAEKVLEKYPMYKIKILVDAPVYHSHEINRQGLYYTHFSVGKAFPYVFSEKVSISETCKKLIMNIYNNYLFYFKSINQYGFKWFLLIPYYHFIKQISFYLGNKSSLKNDNNLLVTLK